MSWSFVVCDRSGTAIGQPLATGRQYNPEISSTETGSFRVKVGSPIWEQIVAGDTTVKVYDGSQALRCFADVITDEITGSGQGGSVAVSFADISFRLSQRVIGKDVNGLGLEFIAQDSGAIAFSILNTINAESATGIVAGTAETFVARTVTATWRKALDFISELGSIQSSYEWALRYVDGAPPTVYLDLKQQIGSNLADTVFFEYGTGLNNCKGFRRLRSVQNRATRVYALGGGNSLVAEAFSTAAEGKGRAEDVLTTGEITDVVLLDALAAQHVAIRSLPRVTVSMDLFGPAAPKYGTDWLKGDFVTARAVLENTAVVSGVTRIWGATISIDESGNEVASPTMEATA